MLKIANIHSKKLLKNFKYSILKIFSSILIPYKNQRIISGTFKMDTYFEGLQFKNDRSLQAQLIEEQRIVVHLTNIKLRYSKIDK